MLLPCFRATDTDLLASLSAVVIVAIALAHKYTVPLCTLEPTILFRSIRMITRRGDVPIFTLRCGDPKLD